MLEGEFSIHIKQKLDITAMQTAINFFQGKHDFSAFRSSGCQAKTPIRSIKEVGIDIKENKLIFIFKSSIFSLPTNQDYGGDIYLKLAQQ